VKQFLIATGLLFSFFSLYSQAQTVTSDIVYTTDGTGTYRADLYQPSMPGVHPAVVLIHGGSWRSGSKREMRKLAMDLAKHGYVGFSIDYDLHRHSFPTSWEESRAAVRFVREHATEYRVDPKRVAVLGTSAGGQLAALVALAPDGPATSSVEGKHEPIEVQAAVILNGGYDLHPKHYLLRRYLGGNCTEIADVCDDASPLMHVHPNAPPFFVGHGNRDHLIPYKQALDFTAALRSTNNDVTLFVAEHGPHSYWKKDRYYTENLAAVEVFLDRVLNAI
jgi:acetyl esterase/lipase